MRRHEQEGIVPQRVVVRALTLTMSSNDSMALTGGAEIGQEGVNRLNSTPEQYYDMFLRMRGHGIDEKISAQRRIEEFHLTATQFATA